MELFIDFEAVSEYSAKDLPYFFCIGKTKKTISSHFLNAHKGSDVYGEIYNIIMKYIEENFKVNEVKNITFCAWGASLEKTVLAKAFADKGIEYKVKDLQKKLNLEGVGQSKVIELLFVPKQYFQKTKKIIEPQIDEDSRRRIDGRIASLLGAKMYGYDAGKLRDIKLSKEEIKVAKEELQEYCFDDVKTMFEIRETLMELRKKFPKFKLKEEMTLPQQIASTAKSIRKLDRYIGSEIELNEFADKLQTIANDRRDNLKNKVKKMLNKL